MEPMILIHDIKYSLIDGDIVNRAVFDPRHDYPVLTDEGYEGLSGEVIVETINSIPYRAHVDPKYIKGTILEQFVKGIDEYDMMNGKTRKRYVLDVNMGMDKKSQLILGLHYKSFKNMESQLFSWIDDCKKADKAIRDIKSAGFLKRLKWLFSGVKDDI